MGYKLIDLSLPLDNNAKEPFPPDIRYARHHETRERAAKLFGLEPHEWPGPLAWSTETVTLGTHTGTHVDAPFHYWPKTGDQPAKTVDQLPLEWFYGPGVLLDFSWKKSGEEITKQDVIEELERIQHRLSPFEIVLIYTGSDKYYYEPGYSERHPGMSAEATRYLIENGIKVMGTDGWGWDIAFHAQAKKYRETGDPNVIWEAHYVGKELEYCQIEKLANLDKIPKPTGFKVICFPIKISGASGGWARPVAVIEEVEE